MNEVRISCLVKEELKVIEVGYQGKNSKVTLNLEELKPLTLTTPLPSSTLILFPPASPSSPLTLSSPLHLIISHPLVTPLPPPTPHPYHNNRKYNPP
ncbi:hypothetical protein Pcinc_042445 [Petrolisthes cinctipes]|uniref:Uncharacterized protein n=1 Tax=Petrolisthes cinctipes TaxID=88211 RepID=A0AAE1EH08_PETCI|nr:hypothetical protein Pcinc_042445 [Petrolisthes cinctipes]